MLHSPLQWRDTRRDTGSTKKYFALTVAWYSHYSLYYDRRSGSWNKSEPTVELDFDFGVPAKDEAKDEPQTVICKGQSSSYSDQIYDADEMLDFHSEDENVEDNTEVEVSVSPLQ